MANMSPLSLGSMGKKEGLEGSQKWQWRPPSPNPRFSCSRGYGEMLLAERLFGVVSPPSPRRSWLALLPHPHTSLFFKMKASSSTSLFSFLGLPSLLCHLQAFYSLSNRNIVTSRRKCEVGRQPFLL